MKFLVNFRYSKERLNRIVNIKFTKKRINNMYMIDLDHPVHENLCLTAKKDNLAWLWHRRLGHASYNIFHKLIKYEMVKRLPNFFLKK